MKRKKLCSLLTAISMIASMATYVPATVSASFDAPTVTITTAPVAPAAVDAPGAEPEAADFTDGNEEQQASELASAHSEWEEASQAYADYLIASASYEAASSVYASEQADLAAYRALDALTGDYNLAQGATAHLAVNTATDPDTHEVLALKTATLTITVTDNGLKKYGNDGLFAQLATLTSKSAADLKKLIDTIVITTQSTVDVPIDSGWVDFAIGDPEDDESNVNVVLDCIFNSYDYTANVNAGGPVYENIQTAADTSGQLEDATILDHTYIANTDNTTKTTYPYVCSVCGDMHKAHNYDETTPDEHVHTCKGLGCTATTSCEFEEKNVVDNGNTVKKHVCKYDTDASDEVHAISYNVAGICTVADCGAMKPSAVSDYTDLIGSYTGNLDSKVKFTLEVAKNSTAPAVGSLSIGHVDAKLTIDSAVDADTEYTIPAETSIIEKVAYEIDEINLADLTAMLKEIDVKGKATDVTDGAFDGIGEGVSVKVSCQSTLTAADDPETGCTWTVNQHSFVPNVGQKNHICSDCDVISRAFSAHTWTAASTTAKEHTCACGASSEDIKPISASDPNKTNYESIHKFSSTTHKCTVCGADNALGHTKTYVRDASKHTIKCSISTCNATLASAENHVWDSNETDGAITVEGITVPAHSHYCKVCGYVAGTNSESNRHVYSNIYVAKWDSAENVGEKELTPVASGGLVCACGAVKTTGHTHTFEAANGLHLCKCGAIEAASGADVHNYNYKFTGTGAYTVNGLVGFDYDTTSGIVCGCGAIDSTHTAGAAHKEASDVAGDTAGNTAIIKANNKHYCICGTLLADSDGNPVHRFTVDSTRHEHSCCCGAVDTTAHNYDRKVVVVTSVASGGDPVTTSVSYGTSVVTSIANNAGVYCTCLKVKDSHEHDYSDASMCDKTEHIHYCLCGESSTDESVHDFNANGVCKLCGAYREHTHTPVNCKCSICGKTVHNYEIVTIKNVKVHQCQACGTVVNGLSVTCDPELGNVPEPNPADAHDCKAVGKRHVCDCGYASAENNADTGHTMSGCYCTVCDYQHHTRTPNTVNGVVYDSCSVCKQTFAKGEICVYANADDKCDICGYLNPNHVHAVDVNGKATKTNATTVNGVDTCRCGEVIPFNYIISSGSQHYNANKYYTFGTDFTVDPVTGEQTITGAGASSPLTGMNHQFDANGFCACGAVKTDLLADVKTANSNLATYASKYSSAYLVRLSKSIEALLAYDLTTYSATTKVAKTAEQQAEFAQLLAEFDELYADIENNKATTGYEMFVVNASSNTAAAYGNCKVGNSTTSEKVLAPVGEDVVLKATAGAGYKFVGWYMSADADAELFAPDATTATYTLKAQNGVTSIYARFKKQDTIKFSFPAKFTVWSSITNDTYGNNGTYDAGNNDGKYDANPADYNFAIGETVTLKFTSGTVATDAINTSTSMKLISLTDNWGQVCALDTSVANVYTYTFEVVEKMPTSFTLNTYTASSDEYNDAYIVFKNEKQILQKGTISATATGSHKFNAVAAGIVPNDPVRNGYIFSGWADETVYNAASESDRESGNVATVKLKELTGDIVLVPVFEKQTFKLTIGEGGRLATQAQVTTNNTTGFAYGENVTLTAQATLNGKKFAGWYIGDVLYSQKKDCSYKVTGAVTLKPKYDSTGIVLDNMVSLSTSDRTKTESGQSFVATAKWEMVSGITINEAGLIFSFNGNGSNLKVENVDNSNVYKRAASIKDKSGVYSYTFGLSSKSGKDKATVNVVSYVTYTDAAGETHTIYSTPVANVGPIS